MSDLPNNHQDNKSQSLAINDDEIDLFELWEGLVAEKKTFWIVLLGVVFLGAALAFYKPSVYQASAELSPPETRNIVELNIPAIKNFSEAEIFHYFIESLFLSDIYLSLAKEQDFKEFFHGQEEKSSAYVLEHFSRALTISLPQDEKMFGGEQLKQTIVINLPQNEKKDSVGFSTVNVSFSASDAEMSYKVLQRLLEKVSENAKTSLVSNLTMQLQTSIDNNLILFKTEEAKIYKEIQAEIERLVENDKVNRALILENIASLREQAIQSRLHRVIQLEEAYKTATQLKIDRPIVPVDFQAQSGPENQIVVGGSTMPIGYWMGTKVLAADIKSLNSRQNDDAFIAELPGLKKQLKDLEVNQKVEALQNRVSHLAFSEALRSYQNQNNAWKIGVEALSKADFKTHEFVVGIVVPSTPINSSRMLIVAVSVVLGLMLGIFIALIRRAVKKRKESQ